MTFCQSIASVILPICQSVDSIGFDYLSRDRLSNVAAEDAVLKRLRARNLKPIELQKALDISPSMASRILDGSRGISVWHLDAIAALLGMTVPELFTDARGGSSYEKKDTTPDSKTVQSETVSARVSHIEQVSSGTGGHRHVARDRLSKSQEADVAMLLRETEAVDKIIEYARAIGRLADPLTLFSGGPAVPLVDETSRSPRPEEVRRTRATAKKRKGGRQ